MCVNAVVWVAPFLGSVGLLLPPPSPSNTLQRPTRFHHSIADVVVSVVVRLMKKVGFASSHFFFRHAAAILFSRTLTALPAARSLALFSASLSSLLSSASVDLVSAFFTATDCVRWCVCGVGFFFLVFLWGFVLSFFLISGGRVLSSSSCALATQLYNVSSMRSSSCRRLN